MQALEHSFFKLSRVLFSPELPITAQVPVESQPCREEEQPLPWLGHLHTERTEMKHQAERVGFALCRAEHRNKPQQPLVPFRDTSQEKVQWEKKAV